MDKLIDDFNVFFEGFATIKVVGQVLEVTIGSRTLEILLPRVTGGIIKG